MKNDSDRTSASLYKRYRRLSLGMKILIYMIAGIAAGMIFGEQAKIVQPLGDLFIKLLMMAAIPLVFFNLLAGLTSLSDVRTLGRLGFRIALFYACTTVVALTLGLIIMSILKPGLGMQLTGEVHEHIGTVPGITEVFLGLVPDNIFHAFSAGRMEQIVLFAVFLGVTTLLMPQEPREKLQDLYDIIARLFREMVNLILYMSPLGIGALAAATVGQYGSAIFGPLALFIGGVWGAQGVMVFVYLAVLYAFTRRSPITFLKQTAPLYATTAATCSSLASLVVSLDVAEKRVKLPRNIFSFTLPLGAQMNKDGTSIMLIGVLLFTAQAAGVDFGAGSLMTMILIGLLLSTGSGGIPGGGLVVALIFVEAFHLPLEIGAIVGGIYRLIDMGGTTINCMGDMVGTIIVTHYEEKSAGVPEAA